ncbi:MAG: hypothetical protein EXS35_05780 [Pedosphaera sp.]|nr:hypothetical protein [Pedosphaera sp.]
MIPREILKKIRQIELRPNRLVTDSAERGCARIPTGFRPKAQGCDAGATLGQRPERFTNRNAVAALPFLSAARGVSHNPVGVDENVIPFTQGSSFLATLGCMPESLWDSPLAMKPTRANSSFIITTPTALWQPV